MGSCGFHGSRKAIFMRLLFDDSDESHLMKKKKKKRQIWEQAVPAAGGIWMVPRGLSQGGALSEAGEQAHPGLTGPAQHCWGCCQYMLTQCQGARVEPYSQKCWGGTGRQLLSTHLEFFAISCIRQHSSHHKITLFSLSLWFIIAYTVNYWLRESFKVEKTSKIKSNLNPALSSPCLKHVPKHHIYISFKRLQG